MNRTAKQTFDSRRTVIGDRLKQHRKRADLSIADLADRSGFHKTTISRIESGKLKPSKLNITKIARALELSRSETKELLDLVSIIEAEFSPWLSDPSSGVAEMQKIFIARERRAKQISNFEMFFISGLLQTPAYMEAIYRRVGLTGTDMRSAIESRKERQNIWSDKGRSVTIVLWEPVLRSRILSLSDHQLQLRHILTLSEQHEGSIRVLPLDVVLDFAIVNAFWLFDKSLVSIETLYSELRIWTPDIIEAYDKFFQLAKVASVSGQQLHDLLKKYL